MNQPRTRGRPGPALTIGLPLLLVGVMGYFATRTLKQTGIVASNSLAGVVTAQAGAPETRNRLRIAGDPRSDFAMFRGEPTLTAALAKEDVSLEYVADDSFANPSERLNALRTGKLDAVLVSLDAFLQTRASLTTPADAQSVGAIVLAVDESAGGDALFLAKGRTDLDSVQATDSVCYASATQSEHLWDFASLTFEGLTGTLPRAEGTTSSACWQSLNQGRAQVAILAQPFTALAEQSGFPKAFSTGQADDLIVNVLVASQTLREQRADVLQRFITGYFTASAEQQRDTSLLATFMARDCGPDCQADNTLGQAIVASLDWLDLEENACLWFGQCSTPSKLLDRIAKTTKLLSAKSRLSANIANDAAQLVDARFVVAARAARATAALKLTTSAASAEPLAVAQALSYRYTVPKSVTGAATPAKVGNLTLPGIAFSDASYQLDAAAQTTLQDIAEQLRSFPAMCIRIIGYSTPKEDPDPAHRLSRLRGFAVAQELTRLDPATFPANRFDIRGLGAGRTAEGKSLLNGTKARKTEFGLFTCTTR